MNKYLTQAINLAKEFEKLERTLNILSIRMDYENGKDIPTIHLSKEHFEKCFNIWEVENCGEYSAHIRMVDGVKVICLVDKEEK